MFKNKPINWKLVGDAVEFYKAQGAEYVEVPWAVGTPAIFATLPPNTRYVASDAGCLVGSAEQSLIELMDERRFTRWCVAASPCWRPDVEDDLHQTYFFKVELFQQTHRLDYAILASNMLLLKALTFFRAQGVDPDIVQTEAGYDLELGGVEIGSYGARQCGEKIWAYGTGLAEPRFSYAESLLG